MRPIAFRVWDKHNKEWVYDTVESICTAIYFNDTSALNLPNSSCDDEIPEIFCLFTGLLDKNGKEIYEGDIVVIKNTYHSEEPIKMRTVVIFRNGVFETDAHGMTVRGFTKKGNWTGEVIGNIYENPELLK